MRDVLFLPLYQDEELVIAADGSAAIGLKEADIVHVPYETVAYFAARVALMEVMCVGAAPLAVVLQNFVHNEVWEALCTGIRTALGELHLDLPIVGSTESNFPTLQSAVGMTVIGMVHKAQKRIGTTPSDAKFAVIGEPLVGDEVMERRDRVLPLSLFRQLLHRTDIYELVPVGSKGIFYELQGLLDDNSLQSSQCSCALPLHASSGPATSLIISFDPNGEEEIKQMARDYFFPIEITS
ncbi:AIR synthase related protein [Thermaerobacillus caldiproteolyticus]|uniref:AIR synthase related protein n=1 Tax=Thermaerobacillus caldiproteolyticus TaxID=247480 RepID=UPI00188A67B2|nr:AIR synthase related protein [Anoxybacillus caldiproteolyticus]QPA29883.1 ATPase [Anoxybacillus caldiproteolyticus]